MAIESKEILSYLNIEGVDSLDQFKEKFDPEFVRKTSLSDPKSDVYKEIVPKIAGRLFGNLKTKVIASTKELGVEYAPHEIESLKGDDLTIENFVKTGFEKVKGLYETKLSDLQTKVGQPDEVAKQWEEKHNKLTTKLTDTEKLLESTKTQNEEIKHTYETEKNGWANQVKGIKLENIIAKDYEKIKWNTAAKPLEKTGFFAEFEKNFKRDLDENGNLEIFTAKGERIPNPAKAGTFMNHLELIEQRAKEANLWEENPHAQPKKLATVLNIGAPLSQNGQALPGSVRKLSGKIKLQ